MPQTIIGIDIGSYSVKIARIERSFKSFELTGFYERAVNYNDVLTREESRISAIQSLIEDEGLTWEHVSTAISGNKVSGRLLDLPFGSRKKISQMIEFEIENHIPFPAEDVVLDYHVISATKEASEIFVTYTQKSDFVKYLAALEHIDINPKWLCVEGVELLNLMYLGMVPPSSVYAIVDIGHSKTTVTVCQGRRFLYCRTIPIGGEKISQQIADTLQVPLDEAERMKVEMAQATDEGEEGNLDALSRKVNSAVRKVLDAILLQIRQTFFSLQSGGSAPVTGMYLSGGTSRLPGIDRYLSSYLKQNVTFLDCRDFHFVKLGEFDSHHAVMPQAISLALRAIAGAGLPDINFRRGEFVYKGNVAEIGGGLRRFGLVMGSIGVLGIIYFGLRYYTLNTRLEKVTTEISQIVKNGMPELSGQTIQNGTQALRLVKGKRMELGDKIDKLKTILNRSSLDVLLDVSSSFPPRDEARIDIDTFDLVEGKVRMTGRTNSFETVDKVRMVLDKNIKFANVNTGNVRKGVGDEVKFDLSFELKGKEEGK